MSQRLPQAQIFEVGPRDGLQSQSRVLEVGRRLEMVTRLLKAGLRDIEVGSFVRDDRIPQLAGTAQLLRRLENKKKQFKKLNPRFWVFVPNKKGLELALDSSADGYAFFIAASNTFCKKNVNRTQSELLLELKELLATARKARIPTRVYLSTITYCPYEGVIVPRQVQKIAQKLFDMGAEEIALGDTTGHATPKEIRSLLELLKKYWSPKHFAMHLHDTRALSLANVWESLHLGVSKFDSAVGGLGGCPYAPGAAGNLATEDLAYMLGRQNLLKNDLDLRALARCSRWLERELGASLPSKVLKTLEA
jgi:hydroxymethylglutaryl-CoA lyase